MPVHIRRLSSLWSTERLLGKSDIELYFLDAPRLILFFAGGTSASLSSASAAFFFFLLFPPPVVGVAVPLNEPDTGVGACEAGVDPGVPS